MKKIVFALMAAGVLCETQQEKVEEMRRIRDKNTKEFPALFWSESYFTGFKEVSPNVDH